MPKAKKSEHSDPRGLGNPVPNKTSFRSGRARNCSSKNTEDLRAGRPKEVGRCQKQKNRSIATQGDWGIRSPIKLRFAPAERGIARVKTTEDLRTGRPKEVGRCQKQKKSEHSDPRGLGNPAPIKLRFALEERGIARVKRLEIQERTTKRGFRKQQKQQDTTENKERPTLSSRPLFINFL